MLLQVVQVVEALGIFQEPQVLHLLQHKDLLEEQVNQDNQDLEVLVVELEKQD